MKKITMAIGIAVFALCGLLVGLSAAHPGQNTNSNMNSNANSNANSNTSRGSGRNRNANANMNSNSDTNTGSNMNSNAGGGGGTNSNTGGSTMLASSDSKFAMTAAAGGMAEVEMARVALQRASSDEVRQYAQKMIDDHTRANDELMQLATSKGVTLPAGPDAKHQSMMRKMMSLSGAAFDREYIKSAGVKDHEQMAKLFTSEQNKGRDADLKAFAARTLPAVQMHLTMARELMSKMTGAARNDNTSGSKM